MTEHSRKRALNDREYELLVEGARRIDDDLRSLEALFVAFVGGRLGLRPGEIAHMTSEWVDWRRRRICIPYHEPCEKGRDGGICGYCRSQSEQRAEYNTLSLAEARLEVLRGEHGHQLSGTVRSQMQATHVAHVNGTLDSDVLERQLRQLLETAATADDASSILDSLNAAARDYREEHSVSQAEAEREMWTAKTETAERQVPFDHNPRAEIYVERFFDRLNGWQRSRQAVNRRVTEALAEARELDTDTTHPHGLRATAATHLAARGIESLALQSMFGWADLSTARNYVAASPENTQRQLQQANTR
ncbi:tyrosine-type recombinase/integrase [Halorussus marinus]|uniref:tyrosine-type recombinase/integrase n=1 Tax=Halorussus marinus TaxID=2505976 RepID=UPI001092059B|nr:tyrosine-type recombinase/integrase [Halorussus marinus]